MVINEFLPNPVGKDTDGEFIELFNNSQNEVSLAGWKIKDASGKTFVFNQKISGGEYLVLNYKTTKISLNNDAETIFLYDSAGKLIDKAGFSGDSVEGRSYSRENNGEFAFTSPTPGKANVFEISTNGLTASVNSLFPNSSIINKTSPILNNLLIGFILALVLAFLSVILIKKLNLFSD